MTTFSNIYAQSARSLNDDLRNLYISSVVSDGDSDGDEAILSRKKDQSVKKTKIPEESDILIKMSKFLLKVLRHQPEIIGLTLTKDGWADINELISLTKSYQGQNGLEIITEQIFEKIVNDPIDGKIRYEISEDGWMVRAIYGHSNSEINISYSEIIPPDVLFHGTNEENLKSILEQGLVKMKRKNVYLSSDEFVASLVAKRHGSNIVILSVDSKKMNTDGVRFFKPQEGNYAVDFVDPKYLSVKYVGHFDKFKK